jgi:hypothetical protein
MKWNWKLLTTVRNVAKADNRHWIVIPFILLSVMLSVPLSSALESDVVSIEEVTISPGGIVIVPIVIEHATGIGGIGIKLSYNPNVVNVTDATIGDFTAFFCFDDTNAANGEISLNTYILGQDLIGDVKVAEVTLETVGNAGDSSVLNLTILSMADQFGNDVNGNTNDGVFVISLPSNEGGGASNDATTTPYPTSTPPITPTSTLSGSSSTNVSESSSSSRSTSNPSPSMNTSTPSTPRSTSTPSSQRNTSTPRTPGFKAILGIAVILVVSRWFKWRSKGKS